MIILDAQIRIAEFKSHVQMIFSIADKTYVTKHVNHPNLHIFKMAAMSKVGWRYCDYILWSPIFRIWNKNIGVGLHNSGPQIWVGQIFSLHKLRKFQIALNSQLHNIRWCCGDTIPLEVHDHLRI